MKKTRPIFMVAIAMAAMTASAQVPNTTRIDSINGWPNDLQRNKTMHVDPKRQTEPNMLPDPSMQPEPSMKPTPSMQPDPKMPPVPSMPKGPKTKPDPKLKGEQNMKPGMNLDATPRTVPEPKSFNEKNPPPPPKMSAATNGKTTADLTGWPEQSRMAVEEATSKYGPADVVSDNELIWWNKGVWKKICINKMETKHSFPIEHTDMMQQTVSYQVPVGKMDDLGRFDGSVSFDRTQGTMSARCDVEANNILALNLANEIVTGKLTVSQARFAFANIVKEKMNGGDPLYMQKLLFETQSSPADADLNTTGLTKAEVVAGIKRNANK